MSARSVRKGKAFEREVVRLLREVGIDADRTPAILEAKGGDTGVDLRGADSTGARYAVQCKVGQNPSVWKAVQELERDQCVDSIRLAVVRRNRAPGRPRQTVAVMMLDDLTCILASALGDRIWAQAVREGERSRSRSHCDCCGAMRCGVCGIWRPRDLIAGQVSETDTSAICKRCCGR